LIARRFGHFAARFTGREQGVNRSSRDGVFSFGLFLVTLCV
jgi:hypothetical protein